MARLASNECPTPTPARPRSRPVTPRLVHKRASAPPAQFEVLFHPGSHPTTQFPFLPINRATARRRAGIFDGDTKSVPCVALQDHGTLLPLSVFFSRCDRPEYSTSVTSTLLRIPASMASETFHFGTVQYARLFSARFRFLSSSATSSVPRQHLQPQSIQEATRSPRSLSCCLEAGGRMICLAKLSISTRPFS